MNEEKFWLYIQNRRIHMQIYPSVLNTDNIISLGCSRPLVTNVWGWSVWNPNWESGIRDKNQIIHWKKVRDGKNKIPFLIVCVWRRPKNRATEKMHICINQHSEEISDNMFNNYWLVITGLKIFFVF